MRLISNIHRCGISQSRGFTLVELMVTIALATILMMVAVPSFVQFRRNAQLSDSVSSFMSAINTARANAMKQGRNTYVVPLNGTSWSSGWRVFADVNWDQSYTAGTDELVQETAAPSTEVTITTPSSDALAAGYFLFNGSGYARKKDGTISNAKMVMANSYRSSTINIDTVGRVRSCKTGSTGC